MYHVLCCVLCVYVLMWPSKFGAANVDTHSLNSKHRGHQDGGGERQQQRPDMGAASGPYLASKQPGRTYIVDTCKILRNNKKD